QRPQVRPVVDVVGEADVTLAVARDVQHVDPGEAPGGHRRGPVRSLDVARLDRLEVRQGRAAGAGDDRHAHGSIATTRAGPALPPATFRGKHETVNPSAGSAARFTSRSIWQ